MLPGTWGADPALKAYPYDPERAKKLLAEAGYPNGFATTLWVPESGSGMQSPVAMSTVIQSNLKAVGVNIAMQTMEWGAYLAKLRTKEQDLFALSWMAGNEDPDMVMYPLLHSSQWTPNGPNRALYKNDKYDELLHQARLTTDQAKRADLYRQAQRLLDRGRAVDLHRSRDPDRRAQQAGAGVQAPPELRPPRRDHLAEVTRALVRRYLARRLLLLVPVLVGVSIVIFGVLHLSPGDPAEIMLGSQATRKISRRLRDLAGAERAAARAVRALDCSRRARRPRPLDLDEAARCCPRCSGGSGATLLLTGTALVLSTAGGIALGVASAAWPRSLLDRLSAVASLFGASMPVVLARHRPDGGRSRSGSAGSRPRGCTRPTAAAAWATFSLT